MWYLDTFPALKRGPGLLQKRDATLEGKHRSPIKSSKLSAATGAS